jgi:hypothetical protein
VGAFFLRPDRLPDDHHLCDAGAGLGAVLLRPARSEVDGNMRSKWDPLHQKKLHRFRDIRDTCVMIMHIAHILQYATLLSLLMGGLGLVVAVVNHREQAKTQIFLAMSAQYNELLKSSSAGFWLNAPPGTELPERTDDLIISMLRFCTLVSVTYILFLEHRIPRRMWELMLRSAERRFRSPLFMREWEHLIVEFEGFPEFVNLVHADLL